MYDLSLTSMISFEISTKCNMKEMHKECPSNYRKVKKLGKTLDALSINRNIAEAKELNFQGCFAFHVFNEPMLDLDLICSIIDRNPDEKYLLWTNGTLLKDRIEDNEYLRKFKHVCITCYDENRMQFYEKMKGFYRNIQIFPGIMDDRMEAYTRNHKNRFACKKPLFEIPIDHYGNILLCTFDYNNSYCIGNIFEKTLADIVYGDAYQKVLKHAHLRIMEQEDWPDICKKCNEPWLIYPHYYEEER